MEKIKDTNREKKAPFFNWAHNDRNQSSDGFINTTAQIHSPWIVFR